MYELFQWQQYKGAFLNKTKYRLKSAPPSTKRGSQSASMAGPLLDEAFPLTFRVKENNFLEVWFSAALIIAEVSQLFQSYRRSKKTPVSFRLGKQLPKQRLLKKVNDCMVFAIRLYPTISFRDGNPYNIRRTKHLLTAVLLELCV